MDFESMSLPDTPDTTAPDGSDVRVLLRNQHASVAHFELGPGTTARAVAHRTVDEIWYVLSGRGEMWRKQHDREQIVGLEPGVCVSIPAGTWFQFRASGDEPLRVLGVTTPPWPGPHEAYGVEGPWRTGR